MMDGRVGLVIRVAERPKQIDGKISFPIYTDEGFKVLEFDKNDPDLDASDPRVIKYKGQNYLTPDEIPELLDPELPQQLLVSAFRRYRR